MTTVPLENTSGTTERPTHLGDGLALDLAASYRLAEGSRPPEQDDYDTFRDWWDWASWDLVLEVQTRWRGKDVVDAKADPNSGGLVVALARGFRASPGLGWDATLSFDYPVHTDLNGTQVSPRWGLLASIGRSF